MESVPRTSSPALRQGLIFGVILAVVEIAFSFLSQIIALGLLGSIIALVIYLVFGILAGQRASALTGKVGTGVLAGFLAGLIASVISSIVSIILTLTNIDAIRQNAQQIANQQGLHITYTNALVIQSVILALVFVIILSSLIALGGGAIGGYIGRSRAPVAQTPYEESMFMPPPPPPGQ
ncbi:MAG TPA: hypothetical protein VKT25_08285 [Ktedonobacteraceae bacterium]|nr:hypothetical protein [Ktedonobacteraceae bacterium]